MSGATIYSNVRIWDGVAEHYLADADAIRVENGKISAVGMRAELTGDALERDLTGLTLIPGLIDAHVHLCLNPEIKSAADQGKESAAEIRRLMAERCAAMVRAGITTARDLGGGEWVEFEVRDRINAGELVGPRLLCSGQPITSIKGHCHFWGGEAAGLEDVMTVLARQVDKGADLIKVMATGGNLTVGSNPAMAQFSEEILTDIVAEARRRGLHVAAHCHGTPGIRAATAAAVTTIEHCSWVSEAGWGMDYDAETAAQIAARGIWVSPTINAGWKRNIGRADFEVRVKENYRRMRAAGVGLIASTDAGIPNVWHHHLPQALPVFSHFAQLSPVETLRAATSDCAKAIGLGAVTGRIAAGFAADLLFVQGDPLADLDVLTRPALVVTRGHVVE